MMEILLLDLLFETEELLHTFYLKMTIKDCQIQKFKNKLEVLRKTQIEQSAITFDVLNIKTGSYEENMRVYNIMI